MSCKNAYRFEIISCLEGVCQRVKFLWPQKFPQQINVSESGSFDYLHMAISQTPLTTRRTSVIAIIELHSPWARRTVHAGRWLFGTGAHYIYFRVIVRTKAFTWHLYIFLMIKVCRLEHRDLEIFKRRRHKKEQVDATNERHQPNHRAEKALNYIPSRISPC